MAGLLRGVRPDPCRVPQGEPHIGHEKIQEMAKYPWLETPPSSQIAELVQTHRQTPLPGCEARVHDVVNSWLKPWGNEEK